MGSAKVDQTWTANRLSTTTRTIRNYVRDGLLKQYMQDNKPVYDREEVEQLAIDRGSDAPALTRKAVFALMNRVQKLEQDNEVIRRALDIQNSPLRPEPAEALGLYRAASLSLGAGKWHLDEMKTWATLYDRMDEVGLKLIGDAAVLDKPWEVFFKLCLAQLAQLVATPGFKTTLDLQILHKHLEEGRKRLRSAVLIWVELHRAQDPVMQVVQTMESGAGALLRRL